MKNVLLIGNGFDLYYKLLTKYAAYLHVIKFLLNNGNTNFSTNFDIKVDLPVLAGPTTPTYTSPSVLSAISLYISYFSIN